MSVHLWLHWAVKVGYDCIVVSKHTTLCFCIYYIRRVFPMRVCNIAASITIQMRVPNACLWYIVASLIHIAT